MKKRILRVKQGGVGKCLACDTVFASVRLNFQKEGTTCPNGDCSEELSNGCFGRFESRKDFETLLWVGPFGYWTNVRPIAPFAVMAATRYTSPVMRRVLVVPDQESPALSHFITLEEAVEVSGLPESTLQKAFDEGLLRRWKLGSESGFRPAFRRTDIEEFDPDILEPVGR